MAKGVNFSYWKRKRGPQRVVMRFDMDEVRTNKAGTRRVRVADTIKEDVFMRQGIFAATKEERENHMTGAVIKANLPLADVQKKIKMAETEEEIKKLNKQYARMEKELRESVTGKQEDTSTDDGQEEVEDKPKNKPSKKKKKKSS